MRTTHDWRNWETCQCGQPGCLSYRNRWDDAPWTKPGAEDLPEQECADQSAARGVQA